MKISVNKGRIGVNAIWFRKLSKDSYILVADLVAKHANIVGFGFEINQRNKCVYQVMLDANENTYDADYSYKKQETEISIIDLPDNLQIFGEVSRYTLHCGFYRQNIIKKPIWIVK